LGSVAVIGAGIIGMTAARALQQGGHAVTVFDPAEPGNGCSFGNAGHVAIDHILPLARPEILASLPRLLTDPLGPLCVRPAGLPRMLPWMLRFAAACRPAKVAGGTAALAALLTRAVPAWSRAIEASGLDPLFRRQGSLNVYERDLTAATAAAAALNAYGLRAEMLSADEVKRLVPGLEVPVQGGRFLPDALHSVDPHGVVLALSRRFGAEGGRIERLAVGGFDLEAGAVRAVHAGGNRLVFDHIVLAAGANAGALARALGANAPLTAERGYHVMLEPSTLTLDIPVTFAERGFVVTPMQAGTRLAGTVELGGSAAPDWRRAEILLTHAKQLFGHPALQSASRWFGNRPTLPDYLPMIGAAPHARNAVLALGHQHLGLTLAAVTAEIVADLVNGRPSPIDLQPFRTDRFGTRGTA
jgi:D-amino-acid dehydrogenase